MRALLVGAAALGALGCRADRWEGFVYPDRGNLARHLTLGEFATLDDCRRACLASISALHAEQRADYECGLNCRNDSALPGLRVCKETLR
jgi:hypothetical protein